MDLDNMAQLFHKFLKMKYKLENCRLLFKKPECGCFTTKPQHATFWSVLDGTLAAALEMVSLVTHFLSQVHVYQCQCMERSTPSLDRCFKLLQILTMSLAQNQQHYKTPSSMVNLVENGLLLDHFLTTQAEAKSLINSFVDVLQKCNWPEGHPALVFKYTNHCAMCVD